MTEKTGRHAVAIAAKVKSMELDLDHNGVYKLELEDGSTVQADFTASQWAYIESMHNHGMYSVKIVGEGDYAGGQLRRIVSIDLKKSHRVIPPEDPEMPTLLHVLAEIRKKYPEDIWDNVPTDGAQNMHHYLYGWPKVDN